MVNPINMKCEVCKENIMGFDQDSFDDAFNRHMLTKHSQTTTIPNIVTKQAENAKVIINNDLNADGKFDKEDLKLAAKTLGSAKKTFKKVVSEVVPKKKKSKK